MLVDALRHRRALYWGNIEAQATCNLAGVRLGHILTTHRDGSITGLTLNGASRHEEGILKTPSSDVSLAGYISAKNCQMRLRARTRDLAYQAVPRLRITLIQAHASARLESLNPRNDTIAIASAIRNGLTGSMSLSAKKCACAALIHLKNGYSL